MTNLQHVALFMFLIFLPMGRDVVLLLVSQCLALMISRKCYQCTSTQSFQDCDAGRYKVSCLYSQYCTKVSVNITSGSFTFEGYAKGCAKTCSASAVPQCNKPGVKCEMNCCSSDYCNGASGRMVSGIPLIASFTASFMYLFGC
ncbi:unnamed protein product [Porites lobata]|uniref:UPAR/Ly6 domain-containing protein n=1 Tax=Porites lobata TaxID=104759 RepID=A0ABN8MS36_9CNID|nr:unnamed protein product [Porites lobata]